MKYFIFIFLLTLSSCSKDEAGKSLKNKLKQEIVVTTPKGVATTVNTLQVNKEIEKQINEKYIEDLKRIVDGGFEKQLEYFEKEELGVFASYGYMFSYIFSSKQTWEDKLRVKSDKYFNNISTEQEINLLYNEYRNDVGNLRNQFLVKNKNVGKLERFQKLDIPNELVTLNVIREHSRNNLIIEFGEGVLELLFGLFIGWIIVSIVGSVTTGPVIPIISFIITFIISIALSIYNDNKLLDKLREQKKSEISIDYTSIKKKLEANTSKFYDENSK
ncbi:hypothetical protein [Riemerella anatipestifer]|uniref:hypothetical protein n=1 Tax=Riemerella anatipestifer TaxID=34085 RepID=UPI00129D89B6|nr:hypothetical protein [Riemerella anatipestifer]MRM83898.1 hypothetical protein [Riemerella anatipestifer]